MGLENCKLVAGLAVSDMVQAVAFYEGKLGLSCGWWKEQASPPGFAPRSAFPGRLSCLLLSRG